MKNFSDLGVKNSFKNFIGDKIKVSEILNLDIIVYDFKIRESKFQYENARECLWLQIELNGKKRVLFTGSRVLTETIKLIEEGSFPFQTVITREGKSYKFN